MFELAHEHQRLTDNNPGRRRSTTKLGTKMNAGRFLPILPLLLWCGGGQAQSEKVTYYYTDPQGTILAASDSNGNVTSEFDYKPYGSLAIGQATDGPNYTSHFNDPETGLLYMQARYYDPEIGRFLNVDPTGPSPGNSSYFNRFSYVGNNPTSRIDPYGMYFCKTKSGCSDFDQAHAEIKKASGAYSSHSAEGKAFAQVLAYYGEKGAVSSSGQSVYIQEGATSLGNPAEIGHNGFTGSDTITFDFSQFKAPNGGSVVEMAASVAHEGVHGVDDGVRRSMHMKETPDTVLSTERNAYRLQSFVNQGLGANSTYGLWRSDWPADQVEPNREASIEFNANLSLKAWEDQ
jgi:RHS repeat-associated protein